MASGPPDGRSRHLDERQLPAREVACERCGAGVGVSKFSPQHTSVQWTRESALACAEFAAGVAAGVPRALIPGCASLRASIDRAVADGRLEVTPP